jgi:hypothetical protein
MRFQIADAAVTEFCKWAAAQQWYAIPKEERDFSFPSWRAATDSKLNEIHSSAIAKARTLLTK